MNLLFVYNANSGKLNAAFDMAHKAISPSTYKCSLCALTHNPLKEKKEWVDFQKASKHCMEFLHKDEFEKKFSQKFEYPVVLKMSGKLSPVISKAQLGKYQVLREMMADLEQLPD